MYLGHPKWAGTVVAAEPDMRPMEVKVRTHDAGASRTRKVPSGIRERHARDCATQAGKKRCSCSPSFEAVVSFARGERRRKTFPSLTDAKAWRTQLLAAKTRSRQRAPGTHGDFAAKW